MAAMSYGSKMRSMRDSVNIRLCNLDDDVPKIYFAG